MANKFDCPHICPGAGGEKREEAYLETISAENQPTTFVRPYIPGLVQPPEKKIYPPNAPPKYLPQPSDSNSGDFLKMGAVGPWAPGHMDWTPQAGITGVRPVYDTYSITRYSTGEWRKNNQATLTPISIDRANAIGQDIKTAVSDAFKNMKDKGNDSDNKLSARIKTLAAWKKKVENTVNAITKEIETLDKDRAKLKGACRILNLPEAIAKECLTLRTHRYEPDLVRDDAEQELVNEMAIVAEIRKRFQETLAKVERQMENNKAAKASIESDWSDKMVALKLDVRNRSMDDESSLLEFHPGVVRWPENATSLEYWEHFCAESVRNCEEVRQNSADLRKSLMDSITKGAQDMKLQADRTNAALAEAVDATEQMCKKLEETLKDNLKMTVDTEQLINYLKDSLRKTHDKMKLCHTRLHSRNYGRPNVENCRDEAQYALMAEAKFVKETNDALQEKMRQAEVLRDDLMKYRGTLEKDIACKRKSLNIDADRLARARAHMPTPEEFAAV